MSSLFLRWLVYLSILLGCAVVLTEQIRILLANPTLLPPDDFVEYWAAGHLNAQGRNPYDPDALLPLQRVAGRDTDEAIMMWNPPWTLAWVMPFGLAQPRLAQLLWLAMGGVLLLWGSDRIWLWSGGASQLRWIAWGVTFTFLPSYFVLIAGQITTFVLSSAIAFVGLLRVNRPLLAGMSLLGLAFKPHLAYLVWPTLLLVAWKEACYRVVLGLALSLGMATAIAWSFNPAVLQQYAEALAQRPPEQWLSPTLGTVLRLWWGAELFRLQFVPVVLGLIWWLIDAMRTWQHPWNWTDRLPLLLAVSFVTAPYGAWPFDLILLLPMLLNDAAHLSHREQRPKIRGAVVVYGLISLGMLAMNLAKVGSFWFLWVAPALLSAHFWLRARYQWLFFAD